MFRTGCPPPPPPRAHVVTYTSIHMQQPGRLEPTTAVFRLMVGTESVPTQTRPSSSGYFVGYQ